MEAGPSVMYSVCSQDLTLAMNFVIIEKPVCVCMSFHNDIHSTDFHTLHNMVDYRTKSLPWSRM